MCGGGGGGSGGGGGDGGVEEGGGDGVGAGLPLKFFPFMSAIPMSNMTAVSPNAFLCVNCLLDRDLFNLIDNR